ncbi:MAG: ParB N-terminal domain-containing protein [Planctomycetaceae bacterium]|nr:ParB N-terminal domain-containing protein [Planctomycetaceae bacterium]
MPKKPTRMSSSFNLLPPLRAADRKVLRASIQDNGVQVPIVIDQDSCIIDGRARHEIAQELGIKCPSIVRQFKDDSERASYALM